MGLDQDVYAIVKIKTIRLFGIVETKNNKVKVKAIKQYIDHGWNDDVNVHVQSETDGVVYATSLDNLTHVIREYRNIKCL